MKEKLKKLGGILVVIAIIGYFLVFYPLIVTTDQYGEPTCKSIVGLTVGC